MSQPNGTTDCLRQSHEAADQGVAFFPLQYFRGIARFEYIMHLVIVGTLTLQAPQITPKYQILCCKG